jgi:hypothetical protein
MIRTTTADIDKILELVGKPTFGSAASTVYSTLSTGAGSSTLSTTSLKSTLSATTTPFLKQRIISELVDLGYWVKATGSRVTKDGWSDASDWDYVVFDPDVKLHSKLIGQGWADGTSGGDDRNFASLRFNDVNLILVKEETQWKKWVIATNMIKALNSKTKDERIGVFDAVFGRDKNMEAVSF